MSENEDVWESELRHRAAYDRDGNRRDLAMFRRGGSDAADFRHFDRGEQMTDESDYEDPENVRRRLLAYIIEAILRYRASGQFTEPELRVIHRVWLEGRSLRDVAAMEGVSLEAIRQRLVGNRLGQGGVMKKAPEFARWWAFKNRQRRRK